MMIALVSGLEDMMTFICFTDWLNSLGPSIKFTVKHSDQQLEVLDTVLYIINNHIESKVYSKPIDGHMYLLPQSSHYRSVYLHIPFGVALRIRQICSQEDWFEEKIGLKNNFSNTNNMSSIEITKAVLYKKDVIRLEISLGHRH